VAEDHDDARPSWRTRGLVSPYEVSPPEWLRYSGLECPECHNSGRFVIHAYAEQLFDQNKRKRSAIRFTDLAEGWTARFECARCSIFFKVGEDRADTPSELLVERGVGVAWHDGERFAKDKERGGISGGSKTFGELLRGLVAKAGENSGRGSGGGRSGDGQRKTGRDNAGELGDRGRLSLRRWLEQRGGGGDKESS